MSLINDALKRASQVQPPAPLASETTAPMHPAEHKRPPAWPLIVVPLLLLLVVAIAAWFVLKGVAGSRKETLSAGKTAVVARELPPQSQPAPPLVSSVPEPPESAKGLAEQSNKKAAPKPGQTAPPSVGTKSSEASASPGIVEAGNFQGEFPSLKLQGLFYRTKNPSVLINSKTLFVGDRVEHVKVISIERDRVTLEWNGETRVLTLE